MSKGIKTTIYIIVAALVAGGLISLYIALYGSPFTSAPAPSAAPSASAAVQDQPPKAGDIAPEFTVENESGEDVSLSQFAGKPVAMVFWATWCGNCREDLPLIERAAKEHGDVQIMLINATDGVGETVETAKNFAVESGITLDLFFDRDLRVTNAYGTGTLPSIIFIDENGLIIARSDGQINEADLHKHLALIDRDEAQATPGSSSSLRQKVTAKVAREIMRRMDGYTIVDVRTAEEYEEKHIKDAVLLTLDTIPEKAAAVLPDKDQPLFVYCRSGVRSAKAADQLAAMGYTQIYDMGGIIDWPYETSTGKGA